MTQPEAIEKMLSGANVFLTGEPGAGKTYTLNEYIRQALQPLIHVAERNLGAGYAREATEEVIKRLKELECIAIKDHS